MSTSPSRRKDVPTARWRWVVVATPDVVLAVFLAACIAVTLALTLGAFTPWLVVPIFIVAVVALGRLIPSPPEPTGGQVAGSLLSLGGAAVWAVLNVPYVAQLFWVTRDPAIYTVLGVWLGDHDGVGLDADAALRLADEVPGTSADLRPFTGAGDGSMYSQGGVALPGLLGVGGWIDGIDGVLKANLVVGAVALVGMYALARRFVGPLLSLVTQAALALAVAFLYLMRAPYSESVVLVAAMAALIWFLVALRKGSIGLALAGGAFLGVATMARIDGPLALAGVGAATAVLALVAEQEDVRRVRRVSLAFLGAGLLSSLVGLLSLVVNHRRYVFDLADQVVLLWAATLASVAVALGAFGIRALASRRGADGLGPKALTRAGAVLGAAVPLAFALWVSRPLWWQGHFTPLGTGYAHAIEAWQAQAGDPVDGTRSYDELTVHWVAWYFGWPMVVLAALGLGVVLYRGIARREHAAVILVVPTAVAAMLYFNKVSVTPDQIWAYRRLLPIITPGMLLGAVLAIDWWRRRVPWRIPRNGLAGLAVVLIVAGPVAAWNDLTDLAEGAGARRVTDALCGRLTSDLVLIAAGHEPANISATVKAVCGRDVVRGPVSEPGYLGRVAAAVDDLQVVAFSPEDLPPGTEVGRPNVRGRIRYWQHTLVGLPDSTDQVEWRVWIGRVEDGRFVQDPRR